MLEWAVVVHVEVAHDNVLTCNRPCLSVHLSVVDVPCHVVDTEWTCPLDFWHSAFLIERIDL